MAGLPPSCLLFGENNASLRALIKGGDGDLGPRTAGGQHASHSPLSHRVYTHRHTHSTIIWHGPRLKCLPGPRKQRAVQEKNDACTSQLYDSAFHQGLFVLVIMVSITTFVGGF